jgi:cytochrome c-type biogenesis protein CcmH
MMKGFIAAMLLLLPLLACAGEAQPLSEDPAAEARLKALSQELRCLVCQNQTLADSNAPLAEDLRREIRELIAKGLSDKEITDYLVARYGDFVRYRPPLKSQTVLLWAGPFLLLAAGLGTLALVLRHRKQAMKDLPDEDDDEEAA